MIIETAYYVEMLEPGHAIWRNRLACVSESEARRLLEFKVYWDTLGAKWRIVKTSTEVIHSA